MNQVYLSLGSNIGNRQKQLQEARKQLTSNNQVKLIQNSSVYETEPWPKTSQPNDHPHMNQGQKWHLNQVILVETALNPTKLLTLTQAIEKSMGKKKREGFGAREIDIDILLYEDQIINLPDLQIPHHHMNDRQFILVPLIEIEPELKDPVSKKPYSDILVEVKKMDDHRVIRFV